MTEIYYLNNENLMDMKLIGYDETEKKGEKSCALCGKGLKNLYIISNGINTAVVGSECVQKIAAKQDKNTLDGIESVPHNKRNATRIVKESTNRGMLKLEISEDSPF